MLMIKTGLDSVIKQDNKFGYLPELVWCKFNIFSTGLNEKENRILLHSNGLNVTQENHRPWMNVTQQIL